VVRKVLICTASRAERHLVEPIFKRAKKMPDLNPFLVEFNPTRTLEYLLHDAARRFKSERPEMLLVPTDRREMVPVAMAAFYLQIPLFHFLGGSSYTGTWDDVNRRVISSFAHIIFCEDHAAKQRLVNTGEEEWRCVVTGTTHFDDFEVEEDLVPKELYDLLLINVNPLDPEDTFRTYQSVGALLDKRTVWIGGNEDAISFPQNRELLLSTQRNFPIMYRPTLPRPKFLGLLKHCSRFISNSSAIIYEAPYFGVQVINPGKRNAERKGPPLEMLKGAADKVVGILATIQLNEKLLMKRYYA